MRRSGGPDLSNIAAPKYALLGRNRAHLLIIEVSDAAMGVKGVRLCL